MDRPGTAKFRKLPSTFQSKIDIDMHAFTAIICRHGASIYLSFFGSSSVCGLVVPKK